MKKIFASAFAVMASLAAVSLTSCEDMLDSENYTGANSGNYPANLADLQKQVNALYGVLNQFSNNPLQLPFMVNNLMSDDCNGAGGTGDVECHAIGHLMVNSEEFYATAWHNTYVGISRASSIIYTDPSILSALETAPRNQLLGEAYFLRGLYMLWGSQMWGDIPAYWQAGAPDPCPQVSAEEEIYPHIISDFATAYKLMSYDQTTQGDGHATKGAAAGMLARAYLFYEGFYKGVKDCSTSIPDMVTPAGYDSIPKAISKQFVVDALENAIASNKYDLVKEYQTLWHYTNKYTAPDYTYLQDAGVTGTWAGNGNIEEMFQIQYGNLASWNGTIGMGFCNQVELYTSLRCDDDGAGNVNGAGATFPYAVGWGQGTINANLWDDWSDADPRKAATILDAQAECEKFVFTTSCTEDAGYYNKKTMAVTTKATADNDQTAGPYTFWSVIREEKAQGEDKSNKNGNCMQGDHFTDVVLLRYADIFLMHAELTGKATYLNEVRKRVGLNAIEYSLAALKAERRFEFAGEGLRFNDLRRWSGKNGGENCEAAQALEKQNGTRVNYCGTWTTMHHAASSWAKRYAATDGFLAIPTAQINNFNDPAILKQNPGWGASVADANMTGTPIY